ncbi:MAG: hypothetical protein FJZ00_03865 [Candidatus Sericytochromatia bacterium]|uniref:Lipoprotein n=1 Tax=Candidatus Tanganyikabacteria bacterium TaxID=2961651 RepID=A0A938BMG5_9BACT|nr:hypothetical protein [Candidatus Tanganyikabacteria bacterium]
MRPPASPPVLRGVLLAGCSLLLAGCPWTAAPYVSVKGLIFAARTSESPPLRDSAIDVISLAGTLGKAGAGKALPTGAASVYGYQVLIDAATLPETPTLFKVVLRNPERAPRDGALLSGVVFLYRPHGSGPEVESFDLNLDATSSLAALAIEYRANMDPEGNLGRFDPAKAAQKLDRGLLAFSFLQAYGKFVAGQTHDPPAASLELAQEASEQLPTDLTKL